MTKDNPQDEGRMSNVRIIEEDKDPTDPGRAADPEAQATLVLHRPTNGEPHDELTRDGFVVIIEDDGLPRFMNDILHEREREWGGDFVVDTVTKYHDGPRQVIVVTPEPEQPPPDILERAYEAGEIGDPEVDRRVDEFIDAHEEDDKRTKRLRWPRRRNT